MRVWPLPKGCIRYSKPSWKTPPSSAESVPPGFIVAAKELLDREPDADEGRIRHWLAGNLCRCTGYDKIVRAVLDAETKMKA